MCDIPVDSPVESLTDHNTESPASPSRYLTDPVQVNSGLLVDKQPSVLRSMLHSLFLQHNFLLLMLVF